MVPWRDAVEALRLLAAVVTWPLPVSECCNLPPYAAVQPRTQTNGCMSKIIIAFVLGPQQATKQQIWINK